MRHLRLEADTLELAVEVSKHLPPTLTGADLSTIATGGLLRATERLCEEADRQVVSLREESDREGPVSSTPVTVDRVLQTWDVEHLEPIVTLDDLLFAARKVVPSVSAAELENYARLGEKYRMSL